MNINDKNIKIGNIDNVSNVIIEEYECFVHLETLSQITIEQSEMLITSNKGDMFFDKPFNGIVLINYPLTISVQLHIKECTMFGSLIWQIANCYKEIYQEELESTQVKETSLDERIGLLNRNKTNGIYGIWGHDLGDLTLDAITIYKNNIIKLNISS